MATASTYPFEKLSVSRWLLAYVSDLTIIVIAMVIATAAWHRLSGPELWTILFFCVFVIGTRQHGLGILGHDGAHGLISHNRRINELLTNAALLPLGALAEGYRPFHLKHHKNVGTTEDPELKHALHPWLGQWQTPLRPWKLVVALIGDCVGGAIPHIGMIIVLTGPTTLSGRLTIGGFFVSVVGLFYWLDLLIVPILWFAALLSSFWFCFRLRIWLEHVGVAKPEHTHRVAFHGVSKFLAHLILPHNIWYHWEHHTSLERRLRVPFYNLPHYRELSPLPKIIPFWKVFHSLTQANLPQ